MDNITDKDLLRAIELMNEMKLNKALAEERLSMIKQVKKIVDEIKPKKSEGLTGIEFDLINIVLDTILIAVDKLTNTNK